MKTIAQSQMKLTLFGDPVEANADSMPSEAIPAKVLRHLQQSLNRSLPNEAARKLHFARCLG